MPYSTGLIDAARVHRCQEQPLERGPESEDDGARHRDRQQRGDSRQPDGGDVVHENPAHHVELTVAEADDAEDREDERQAERHESVDDPDDQSVGDLGGDERAVGDAVVARVGEGECAGDEHHGCDGRDDDEAVGDLGGLEPERNQTDRAGRGPEHGAEQGRVRGVQIVLEIAAPGRDAADHGPRDHPRDHAPEDGGEFHVRVRAASRLFSRDAGFPPETEDRLRRESSHRFGCRSGQLT